MSILAISCLSVVVFAVGFRARSMTQDRMVLPPNVTMERTENKIEYQLKLSHQKAQVLVRRIDTIVLDIQNDLEETRNHLQLMEETIAAVESEVKET